jgi:hypothetical protein
MSVANKSVDKGTKHYHLYNNDGNRIELEQSDGEKDIGVFEYRAQDTTLWYPTCDMMAFGLSAIYNYFLCSVAKKTFYPLNYFLTYFIPMHLMQTSSMWYFVKR